MKSQERSGSNVKVQKAHNKNQVTCSGKQEISCAVLKSLPSISHQQSDFPCRPFSEDTQIYSNKIYEGKKTFMNRKTQAYARLSQQTQQTQYSQQGQPSQTRPTNDLKMNEDNSILLDAQSDYKSGEEFDKRQRSGYVEKFMSHIKNSQIKQQEQISSLMLSNKDALQKQTNMNTINSMTSPSKIKNSLKLQQHSLLQYLNLQDIQNESLQLCEKPKVLLSQFEGDSQQICQEDSPNPYTLNQENKNYFADIQQSKKVSNVENNNKCNDNIPLSRENSNDNQEKGEKILKWKYGDFIGAGSFGQVFTAMNCNTGEIFVVKKIIVYGCTKPDKEFLDDQEKEIRIMQTLSHKHIIQYKGYERHSDCLCIFLEYMSEGNIDQMLKKFGALEEQTIKVYARQILSGIEYLHSKKVIHKDIKGANILVGSDGIVKLSDFGCAKQLELTLNSNKEMNKTLKGSVPWMSPEIVTQTKYDTKADIWSFGCTLLEMASAKAPWSNYEFDNPIAAIMKIGLSNEIPQIPENISPELDAFIRSCLQRDPSMRPTATQLLSDPFLNELQ